MMDDQQWAAVSAFGVAVCEVLNCTAVQQRAVAGFARLTGSDTSVICLPGWVGGEHGDPSSVTMDVDGPREITLTEHSVGYVAAPGERLRAHSGGGGGWGPALERDPGAVLEDVRDGLVSIGAARDRYGVALIGTPLAVDERITRLLRQDASPID